MHVAIIPDGLRRWAKMTGISYDSSYKLMCEKLRDFAVECFSLGVEIVTLYLSSVNNFTRTNEDIESGCIAERDLCLQLLPEVAQKFDVKVVNAGTLTVLPDYLREAALLLQAKTSDNKRHKLYLCQGYNPIDEVYYAFTNYRTGDDLFKYLWVTEPVDLIVRTGKGEVVTNLLPLQCAGHAKIHNFDELFLGVTNEDFSNVVSRFIAHGITSIQSVDDILNKGFL